MSNDYLEEIEINKSVINVFVRIELRCSIGFACICIFCDICCVFYCFFYYVYWCFLVQVKKKYIKLTGINLFFFFVCVSRRTFAIENLR